MTRRAQTLDPKALAHAAAVIKCVGHPLRLRLLEALDFGDRTVTELAARTGASQAMVSQQLATMRGRGVVVAERDGPFVRYAISEPKVHQILACIRGCGAAPKDHR